MSASGHAFKLAHTYGLTGLLGLLVAGCEPAAPPREPVPPPSPLESIVVPPVPPDLSAPPGSRVSSHIYVQGVQIYAWLPDPVTKQFKWMPVGTQAALFNAEGKLVGYHCKGPTWESKATGREVKGVILAEQVVDTNAIPWQLFQATNSPGPGMARTTCILRVNTQGGLPPKRDGEHEGQRARIPFGCEDFFFRASDARRH